MVRSLPASPPETSDAKPLWPKFSLLISILLWLLAWELILWFVPVQPRLAIRTSDYLAGFSPDGGTLVTTVQRDAILTGQIRLWDLKTGRDLGLIGEEGTNLLPNVVYLPQRNLLSDGGFSTEHEPAFHPRMSFVLFDLAARQERGSIQAKRENNAGTTLCFSADGRTLACCTHTLDEGELKLVDVATGKVRAHFKGGQYGDRLPGSGTLAFSRDGSILAITETKRSNPDVNFLYDQKVIVLDTATGERRWILQDYEKWAWHLTFSPDGTMLAMYCVIGINPKTLEATDTQIRIWDLATGKQLQLWSFKAQGFPVPEFLPDGKGLAMRDEDGVRFCDLITGKEFAVADISPSDFTEDFGFSVPIPGTHLLAVHANRWSKPGLFFQWCATLLGTKALGEERCDSELAFLNTRTGEKMAAIVRPSIGDVQIYPDGKTLALSTLEKDDSIVEIWDIPPRKPLRWVLGLLAIPSVVTVITLMKIRQRFFRSRDRQGAVRGTAS